MCVARVSWCFRAWSQPHRIISGLRETFIKKGLRETFIKRYLGERTNMAQIKPEEQREKAESGRENSWNEKQSKGAIKTEIDSRTE